MESTQTSPALAANFKMIDIGEKKDTERRAVASGYFYAQTSTITRIRERTLPKGDVLVLCEVAGIQGAKKTADLLPLCHPLSLTSVRVWHEMANEHIQVFCEAKTVGKTGVEMEALGGVTAALLCIYDLTKGIDPVLRIGEIKLEIKEGGKSGKWIHPNHPTEIQKEQKLEQKTLNGIRSAILILSDRCSKGEAEDRSGPIAQSWLSAHGAELILNRILPDDQKNLEKELFSILKNEKPALLITSGGTGVSPRDTTPEAILSVARELGGKEIPGFGELLRAEGAHQTKMSWLSRSTAVLIDHTLIVCLPGNPKAVQEGLDTIAHLIPHALYVSEGGNHEKIK